MRAAWIVLAVVELLGCSSGSGHDGEPAERGGSGGVAGSLVASGGTGAVSASGSGGTNAAAGSSGHIGGSPAQAEAGMGGEPSEAGAPESGAGGQAGMPTADAGAPDALGGQPGRGVSGAGSGSGGRHPKGGSGGAPPSCDCDAAHDCVDGACVIKPECDCTAFAVECSPLSTALRDKFACPIEMQCGACEPGQLCVAPGDSKRFGLRLCLTPSTTTCTLETDSLGCGADPDCSVQYSSCSEAVIPTTGKYCPTLGGPVGWWCGPPL
jgi:hypothetical protein